MTTNPVIALANGFVILANARAARSFAPLSAAIITLTAPLILALPRPIAQLFGAEASLFGVILLVLASTASLVILLRTNAASKKFIETARDCAAAAVAADSAHDRLLIADRIDREIHIPHARRLVDTENLLERATTINRALSSRDHLPLPMVLFGLAALALATFCINETADSFALAMIAAAMLASVCAARMLYARFQVKGVMRFLESAISGIEETGQEMSSDILAMIEREINYWHEIQKPLTGWPKPARP